MKYKILDLLYKNKGSFVSGQKICDELGISRTAVWKHIKTLGEEGYNIVSTGGKGYSLTYGKDILNGYEIERRLREYIPVFFYKELDSTNDKAKELVSSLKNEISLITCSVQRSGRGRMGRTFESANDKGAWCSFVLKPRMEPEKALLITIAAAAAVSLTLEKAYKIKPGIKWPNDIIVSGKKVSGILSEMNCETNFINYIVIGIGINVSQEKKDFSEEVSLTAGSMYGLTGIKIPHSEIIASLCYNIQEVYRLIKDGNSEKILELWKRYTITDGEEIKIFRNGEAVVVRAIGINANGSLIVEYKDGARKEYNSGEISIKRLTDSI